MYAKNYKSVYLCDDCEEPHDDDIDAITCCAEGPAEMFQCLECNELHDSHEGAGECCDEEDKVRCTKCFRRHSPSSLQGVAVRVVGTCTACTPTYTYDQQFAIEDAFYEASDFRLTANVHSGAIN